MRRRLLGLVSLLLLAATPAALASPAARWSGWSWLMGKWAVEAKPGEPSGGFSLVEQLDGKVLVRRNQALYPATKDHAASAHHDLMVVYQKGSATRADYWDNEGHHIAYTAAVGPDRIVLTSDPAPGPRFRLTFQRRAHDSVAILFELAPPAAPQRFREYKEGLVHRVR